MALSRLSHAISACRAACISLSNVFQRERVFTGISTFLSLMTLSAVKKSQSYVEFMRQIKLISSDMPQNDGQIAVNHACASIKMGGRGLTQRH